jgi:ABC-2 type transport system ATP-binding protein
MNAIPGQVFQPALELEGIGKRFIVGKRSIEALKDVSIRISPGVVTGLIGPDGAGKTTLMRLAAGLLLPDSGQLQVLGMDALTESLLIQANIGYMPQRFGLYEDLSVQENLDLYADLQGLSSAERPARYDELMQMTGLGPFTKRLAGQLSGGMKQKLGLACTLVRAPRLLLLDEPTVGVDPISRRELWSIVYRLVRDEGMSVLLSTAYLDEAERCTEVVMLHQGRVLGHDTPTAFSSTLKGRSYFITAPSLSKRALQASLDGARGVADAVLQRSGVRLVMHERKAPDPAQLLPGVSDASVTAVEPRFEDVFVTRLGGVTTHEEEKGVVEHSVDHEQTVIKVDKLSRHFGDFTAVNQVSFSVKRGEVFGLLGANGAGKSTTFRMLCGLLPPSAGHLEVADKDLRTAAASARARIGYMSQKFSLYGNFSVCQNLRFFASAYNLKGRKRKQRIDWALTHFELEDIANNSSGDLPLGYKQRLALACALMHEPEILFLDEPTSGVDPLARREFWRRINDLAVQGVTVLVTTHFMEEAEYCDRLVIMAAGEILTLGTPESIKQSVRSANNPEPTMEDAFIHLIEEQEASA